MNGPQHYAEAERLLAEVANAQPARDEAEVNADRGLLAAAQIHATLALAASMATTAQYVDDGNLVALHADPGWEDVLGFTSIEATS